MVLPRIESLLFLLLPFFSYTEVCADLKVIASNKYDRESTASERSRSSARFRSAARASWYRFIVIVVYATFSANMFLDGSPWTTSFATYGIWWQTSRTKGQVIIVNFKLQF